MFNKTTANRSRVAVVLGLAAAFCATAPAADTDLPGRQQAQTILDATGVRGGLIVQLGCGDGKLAAALCAGDSYLVHALDTDESNVEAARKYIRSLGLYGKVSVEKFGGRRLPYNDGMVNLLVAGELGDVPAGEVTRVLAPGGAAMIAGKKTTKPWPDDIDQWTHFLHDTSNNAVARDRRVGPPQHLQWETGPKRTRDHDALASLSAMTTSDGRLFYIIDEGPTSMIHRPADWKLVARDAFNGKLLWKRGIDSWLTHLRYFRSGPVQLPRRLVSVGQRVYATLGFDAPISLLEAATGKTLQTYQQTKNTEEFICHDGLLLVVLGDPHQWERYTPKVGSYWEFYDEDEKPVGKTILAIDAATGKTLWKVEGRHLEFLVPLSLVAQGDRALYLDNRELHCLDRQTGKQQWSAPFQSKGLFLRNYTPTVVIYKDTVVCQSIERLAVFSLEDGRQLWQNKGYAGFASPGDLFVIDDVVWTFPHTATVHLKPQDIPGGGKEFLGFDLRSGEVVKTFDKRVVWPGGHHHRCYRNKATERFIICGRRGLEFVDLEGRQNVINWWVRGVCQYGILPANGLVYTPPTPCQCFNLIKFDGFHALAARSSLEGLEADESGRLLRGPAYGSTRRPAQAAGSGRDPERATAAGPLWTRSAAGTPAEQWPTYRHDASRSGASATRIAAKLRLKWRTPIGKPDEDDGACKLSSVVVADGRLLLSAVERNTLHCLDAASGEPQWTFVAGGRIDSPPTVCGGMALFGSGDGSVYAVRADDGRLIWRRRLPPVDRRIVVRDRLESVWPIHGSVLVLDGVVYCAAGRSSFIDGGIGLYALDAATGRLLNQTSVHTKPTDTAGALGDVLIYDGRHINMRHLVYDRSLAPQQAAPGSIMANTGLLEDSWFHRQNWVLGVSRAVSPKAITFGHRPDARRPWGKLIVFDGRLACGAQNPYTSLKLNSANFPPTHTGHLHQKYARYKDEWFPIGTRLYAMENKAAAQGPRQLPPQAQSKAKKNRGAGVPFFSTKFHKWTLDTPLQIRAMVLAGDELFVAGWVDRVSPRQSDSGKPRIVLWRIDTADGNRSEELALGARPVFDGMAAAYGKLYMASADGSVACFGR